MPLECNIGKLQVSGADIKGLSRDDRYRLLTTEPLSTYTSMSIEQFPEVQTCLAKNITHGCITVHFVMECIAVLM